jgi:hypothetical protein
VKKTIFHRGVSQPLYGIINHSQALHYKNKTFITFIGKNTINLSLYAVLFDHASKQLSPTVKIGESPLMNDDHGNPSLSIDSKNYLHIFFGSHNSNALHYKSCTPLDICSWQLESELIGSLTYPQIYSKDGYMYSFFRQGGASNGKIVLYTSPDNGQTWTSPEDIIQIVPHSGGIYLGGSTRIGSNIYFAWTKHENAPFERRNIYYARYNVNTRHLYNARGEDQGLTINDAEALSNCLVTDTGADETNQPSLQLYNRVPYLIYPRSNWYWYFKYWRGDSWSPEQLICFNGHKYNYSDFIINNSTDIEAYLTVSPRLGIRGGNIEKWVWNGYTWGIEEVIAEPTHYMLGFPYVPINHSNDLKLIFCEINPDDYSVSDLEIYVSGDFNPESPHRIINHRNHHSKKGGNTRWNRWK